MPSFEKQIPSSVALRGYWSKHPCFLDGYSYVTLDAFVLIISDDVGPLS